MTRRLTDGLWSTQILTIIRSIPWIISGTVALCRGCIPTPPGRDLRSPLSEQLANYWLAAARAGYAKPDNWQAWADRFILSVPAPPLWVINMSMAQDVEQLRRALAEKLESEWETGTVTSSDDAEIGYAWLRYQKREIALADCLRLAGDRADAGTSHIECEIIYDLLNRLEAGEPQARVESEARRLLAPFAEMAQRQWEIISNMATL